MPRNIASHWDWSGGRCAWLIKIPLEVPPRRKEAGIGLATPERVEEHLADRKRLVAENGARIRHSDAITY
jgi:hypothetical protein